MALMSSGVIETYIQRVTELSQSTKRLPTSAELGKIVAELGIAPEEIAKAEVESQAHYTRAQGYLRLQYWDEAIAELREGIAFNPSSAEMLLASATAYLGRWRQSSKREDGEKFHQSIRHCLEIQPDSEAALDLLQQFKKIRQRSQQRSLYLGLFSCAVIAGVFGFFLIQQQTPYILQKRADLETLNQEIASLRSEQELLKQQLNTLQSDQLRASQVEIVRLNRKVNNLEDSLATLKKNMSLITIPLLPPEP
ncbi:MAG: hypothetical protein ACRC6M_02040 [Microcystaceae cyanobacterium]